MPAKPVRSDPPARRLHVVPAPRPTPAPTAADVAELRAANAALVARVDLLAEHLTGVVDTNVALVDRSDLLAAYLSRAIDTNAALVAETVALRERCDLLAGHVGPILDRAGVVAGIVGSLVDRSDFLAGVVGSIVERTEGVPIRPAPAPIAPIFAPSLPVPPALRAPKPPRPAAAGTVRWRIS